MNSTGLKTAGVQEAGRSIQVQLGIATAGEQLANLSAYLLTGAAAGGFDGRVSYAFAVSM